MIEGMRRLHCFDRRGSVADAASTFSSSPSRGTRESRTMQTTIALAPMGDSSRRIHSTNRSMYCRIVVSYLSRTFSNARMRVYSIFSLIIFSIWAFMAEGFVPKPAALEPSQLSQSTRVILQKYAKAAQWIPTAYSHCLTNHHLATECVTAGCMAGLGDYMAQRKSQKPWSPKRSLHFILKGLGEGVMWSIWYHKADVAVAFMTQSLLSAGWVAPSMTAVVRTILSLVTDLFIACPFIYAFWDIPLPALLSGTPLRDIPRQIRQKLGEMMLASLKLWTPVNVLIYNSPLKYRVLLMATADVFWQSIVSSIASRELVPEEDQLEQGISLIQKPVPAAS